MKTTSKHIFFATAFASLAALSGCFEHPSAPDADATIEAVQKTAADAKMEFDCFDVSRETVRFHSKTTGQVRVAHKDGNKIFVLVADQVGKKFQPCKLPDQFRHEGMKVVFFGEEKRMFPDEQWAGNPFVISQISKL